ncbi:hypothetical protein SDC9_186010 [bioreactor metagenome]|uniref:Uncharacterized protein n=1 Tax=bioreactor metagenome TaxID=1076179 RepID=A0A645HIP3_9ZZZZ
MEPDRNADRRADGLDPLLHLLRQESARGIREVDIVRAIGFHLLRLLRDALGREHVRHHQETDRHEPHLLRRADVLRADIRLGGVRGNADDRCAAVLCPLQIGDGADARQEQHRDLRAFYRPRRGLD